MTVGRSEPPPLAAWSQARSARLHKCCTSRRSTSLISPTCDPALTISVLNLRKRLISYIVLVVRIELGFRWQRTRFLDQLQKILWEHGGGLRSRSRWIASRRPDDLIPVGTGDRPFGKWVGLVECQATRRIKTEFMQDVDKTVTKSIFLRRTKSLKMQWIWCGGAHNFCCL